MNAMRAMQMSVSFSLSYAVNPNVSYLAIDLTVNFDLFRT